MCIIIVNNDNLLSRNVLKNSWDANRDGAGLMYAVNGKIVIFKELDNFTLFYNKYKDIRTSLKTPIVLHFRISTGGLVDFENCHPFLINSAIAFCHNGIIADQSIRKSLFSDTYHFNESILKKLPINFLSNPAILELIRGYIGNSKLAFLDRKGTVTIINDKLGHYDEAGNWYSNFSYIKKPDSPRNYSYFNKFEFYGRDYKPLKVDKLNGKEITIKAPF